MVTGSIVGLSLYVECHHNKKSKQKFQIVKLKKIIVDQRYQDIALKK